MAPHSSTLAWKIPWMEEPGGLQSMGSLESDTTERLHFHFSLSCIGEGNGNPLQCSCLENPRDGGAWWAAVYGVAQSQTRLKWLSSSSEVGHFFGVFAISIFLFFFFFELSANVQFFFFFLKKWGILIQNKYECFSNSIETVVYLYIFILSLLYIGWNFSPFYHLIFNFVCSIVW